MIKIFIDTNTKESTEKSICQYFNVDPIVLHQLFYKISLGEKPKLKEYINFIQKYKNNKRIDYVLFNHLSRRLNSSNEYNGVENLRELLTTENAISCFLNEHSISFELTDEHIGMKYKGKDILLEEDYRTKASRLKVRLGYIKGYLDYCVNGFLFKEFLNGNYYYRSLHDAPEFISDLGYYFNDKTIVEDYKSNSQFYCFQYNIPLPKIQFDALNLDTKIVEDDKEVILLILVLDWLYFSNYNNYCDNDNVVIRLLDSDRIEEKYFIKKEKLV